MKQKGMGMLDFSIDKKRCTKCGQCVADCPMHIIGMGENGPAIAAENEAMCVLCQHCLSVCPSGALSIGGFSPQNSARVTGKWPSADQMETLIRERRSIRQFKPENVDKKILRRILDVAASSPTGKNAQQVRFTVIADRKKLAQFRHDLMSGLSRLVKDRLLPPGTEFVSDLVQAWEDKKLDRVFRDAPHLLITSAPKAIVTPIPDCLIALTTFELFAQTLGVGTLWCGYCKFIISDLIPDFSRRLGIPEDHVLGYSMLFGYPAVQYTRMAQHKPADIHWIDNS